MSSPVIVVLYLTLLVSCNLIESGPIKLIVEEDDSSESVVETPFNGISSSTESYDLSQLPDEQNVLPFPQQSSWKPTPVSKLNGAELAEPGRGNRVVWNQESIQLQIPLPNIDDPIL
ncbi:Uncharacterised protein g1354 [Pycnogonum litorale]